MINNYLYIDIMSTCKLLRVQIVKPISGMSGIQTYTTMLKERMEPFGVVTKTISYAKGPFVVFQLLKQIQPKYDIIHVQNLILGPLLASSIASRIYDEKVIITVHNPPSLNKTKIKRRMTKILLRQARAIISVSWWVDKKIKQYIPAEVPRFVIYPGVDTNRFNPYILDNLEQEKANIKNKKVVLFVGRLVRIKGIITLIEALAQIKMKEVVLLVCGEGELLGRLRQMVDNLGLNGRVIFAGRVSNNVLPKYYAMSSVCVIPSLFESFGIVALEAMSMGKPIIASDVGGIPEIIEHNNNGLLVKPGDSLSLAESITKILSDNDFANRLGINARRKAVSCFSMNNMLQQTVNVYRFVNKT
jgi:glycosyltransferase involved in cell wall biosynthesis